ncbi:histidine ammonia-lyase [Ekhidna sp. To15]|uniref:histidine ammonia-lyase n=1 Tax=Ekhidna sp. To15 TaxID=3395267 RepID=UPI003F524DFE
MTTTPTVFHYGEDHLTASIAISIAHGNTQGVLSAKARKVVNESSDAVKVIANGDKAVYGINTGFGPLCTTQISKEETSTLQKNLLMSHAVGLGEPIKDHIAKLMMILKVHALAKGFSGVQESTIDRIIFHIDNDITPHVPEQGSVGASGDLAPLSHLFLPLIGLGKVKVNGSYIETDKWLNSAGLKPIELGAKEGLGLINGTQFIAAHAIKVVEQLQNVLVHADISGALMVEGLLASVKPFSPELHEVRAYKGSRHVASFISSLLDGSKVVHSHANCARVQDPYSLRCIPQVHGASRNAWLHVKEMLEVEINSVTDNPIVFNSNHTISGGNFHGQPLALPIDYACLAASEIGNISDRRIYLSLEGDTPGVPKLLLRETGTNSGFMIPQYTTAALASENKGMCFPASADSIPTSLGQEDHVSMGSIGGRKALRVVENVEKIIGVEIFCAAQAVDFHRPLKSSKIMSAIHDHVRSKIAHITKDVVMNEMMETAIEMVKNKELISVAQETADKHSISLKTDFSSDFDLY